MDVAAKSRVRIAIESLLIELNEEIFALSEEVANSYQTNSTRELISHAREFEHARKLLVKKVQTTIDDDPVAKLVRREGRDNLHFKERE